MSTKTYGGVCIYEIPMFILFIISNQKRKI